MKTAGSIHQFQNRKTCFKRDVEGKPLNHHVSLTAQLLESIGDQHGIGGFNVFAEKT